MKTVMIVAAALGFSASGAMADCLYHKNASAPVDRETTTASITKSEPVSSEQQGTIATDEQAKSME
ncbi:hypothetical protein MRS76_14780 [Rhizobiaceae bacterium n13]|uniref:DUF680 domain-containing protein n=1 Tax=Ferirhizobium litorale TaxID=2927786 RepID=A0AAE3QGE5_9HYPH|nr:hypothetical protein [Fererhizobium litorale]MDI7863220.1 hypothetical protein [Fererhizobium litorale]MDI7923045.1 hypothetical protein [Fererhizobium litorale]